MLQNNSIIRHFVSVFTKSNHNWLVLYMRNTIILTATLFFAVIAASIYYFKNLDGDHNQSAKPLRYLPENTLFVAAIANEKGTDNVFKDFEIFDAIVGFDNIKLWADFKSKILNNEKVHAFTKGADVYISFHPEDKQIVPLFTVPTTTAITETALPSILNEISGDYKVTTIDSLGQKIYAIRYGQKDSVLHALYYHDILFASPSISLLGKISAKHSKHLSEEQIDFFLKNNPRKTPLSIYFPHQQYDSLINLTQRTKNGPFLQLFKKLQGQSAWNINFKEDALILTGESELDQYPENYASIFKNQQKTTQGLYKYFPSNTAIYAEFSVSNRPTFQKDLYDLFKRRKEKNATTLDTSKTKDLLDKALGDHFALVETNNQNYLGFINIKDSTQFKKLKNNTFESTTDSIGRFMKSNVLYRQYGDVFENFQRPYYTVLDSVLIVSNSLSTLSAYRKDYLDNDLLIGTLSFIKLDKLQGNEANITVYTHTKNANSRITNALNQPFKANYSDKESFGFQDFFSWSIQLSGNSGKIASQIYAIYKSKNTLGVTPEWTVSLGNRAITKPYVFNQSDTSQFILIQELDHTIHAISPKGQETWSKVFAGRVIGDIQQAEDRSIVLVTDKNLLYRFDVTGKTMKGYPVTLPAAPLSAPLLTTVKGQKALLLATEKSIYAFDLEGRKIQQWQSFEVEGSITTSILAQEKNYIIGTSTGTIYWINDNGQKIDQIKRNNTAVKALSLFDNYKIVALDSKGGLNLISNTAESKYWTVTTDTAKYYGDFINVTSSNIPNIAVISGNYLKVFSINDTLKTDFQHHFTKPITDEMQFFESTTRKNAYDIGVASKATNLLYLFKEDGQLVEGFPTEGQPLFYYGKIDYNSATYLLCMRRDHKLYAFRQQK